MHIVNVAKSVIGNNHKSLNVIKGFRLWNIRLLQIKSFILINATHKRLKVDDAVMLGKQQEQNLQGVVQDEGLRMNKRILILLFSFIVGTSTGCAEENNNTLDGKSGEITNIGFEKNPPAIWVKKFPMCDKFLKVKWIDKKKKIGFSKYDIYQEGKKTKVVSALVHLHDVYPRFEYDFYEYEKKNKLEDIYNFIRKGDVVATNQYLTINNGEKITFWPNLASVYPEPSLSDNYFNVCVTYPDEQRIWLLEGRKVKNTYLKDVLVKKYKNISKFVSIPSLDIFKEYLVTDMNFDGIDDYYGLGLIYSFGEQFYSGKQKRIVLIKGETHMEYIYPPNNKKCLKETNHDFITFDSKSYYINNKCNLNNLIKR